MSDVPAVTILEHAADDPGAAVAVTAQVDGPWDFGSIDAVEIVAPDRYSAALLVDFAAPSFLAEILAGPPWIVRFEPPAAGGAWVIELFALVERWLISVPLPCAKVLHGGRNYLFRASTGLASEQRGATTGS